MKCKLELVQSSLLGGLLSNMLLVLGMAFIGMSAFPSRLRRFRLTAYTTVGGFRFHSQEFQPMVAQLNSSLMTVSVISLIVPAAFVSQSRPFYVRRTDRRRSSTSTSTIASILGRSYRISSSSVVAARSS